MYLFYENFARIFTDYKITKILPSSNDAIYSTVVENLLEGGFGIIYNDL